MIQKPTIIITSLGRTGTKFFQEFFADVVPEATSLHEPDYLNFGQYGGINERIKQVVRQIRESGFLNLVIRKSLGRWDLIRISDRRLRGTLGYADAARQVLAQRRQFVRSRPGSVYIESSSAYFGLVDVLKDVYREHRVVYVVRDGRDWVRSKMNFGTMYEKGKIRSIISYTWPTAWDIEGDPYQSRWATMSRFEKICWAWSKLNQYALETVQQNPNAKVFRFENIFNSEDRYRHLAHLVEFSTNMPGLRLVPSQALQGWLDENIHVSNKAFPSWADWSASRKQRFLDICGPLMEQLGYGSN